MTMSAALGFEALSEFQPEVEDFLAYLECVELFFVANDVAEEKRF